MAATRRIEAGTAAALPGDSVVLPHTAPEGHRFAVAPVPEGADLLAWGLPFAQATRDMATGAYLGTGRMLEMLCERRGRGVFPPDPNIENRALDPYVLGEITL